MMSFINYSVMVAYEDIEHMVNDTKLVNGMVATTLGYHSDLKNDGPMIFVISNTNDPVIVDNGNVFKLANGNYAFRIENENPVSVKSYGAYGDGVHDDTDAINRCLKNNDRVIFGKHDTYKVSGSITLDRPGMEVDMNFSTILRTTQNSNIINIIHNDIDDMKKQLHPVTLKNAILDMQYSNASGIYVRDVVSDVIIDNVRFFNNKTRGINIAATTRNDSLSDDVKIKVDHIYGDTADGYNKETVGIIIRHDNVELGSDINIRNHYIAIQNSAENISLHGLHAEYKRYPSPVDTVSAVMPSVINNSGTFRIIENLNIADYTTLILSDVNGAYYRIIDSRLSFTDNYKLDHSYLFYYTKDTATPEKLKIDIQDSKFTGALNCNNYFTNIGCSMTGQKITDSTLNGYSDVPLDKDVMKYLNIRANDGSRNDKRACMVEPSFSHMGLVTAKLTNRISNMFIVDSSCSLYGEVSGSASINSQYVSGSSIGVGAKTNKDNISVNFNGKSGAKVVWLIPQQETEDYATNRIPTDGSMFFGSFVIQNGDSPLTLTAYLTYKYYDSSNKGASYQQKIFTTTIEQNGAKRRLNFMIPITAGTLSSLSTIKPYSGTSITFSYIKFVFEQTSNTSDGKDATIYVGKPLVTRVDDLDMLHYLYETPEWLSKTVYEPYANSFGLGLPSVIDIKENASNTSKKLKIMSIPWIGDLAPYYSTKNNVNRIFGQNPFVTNYENMKNYVTIIPEPCGFRVKRASSDTKYLVPDYSLDLINFSKMVTGNITLYFNVDILYPGANKNEGIVTVYDNGSKIASYDKNDKEKKSITLKSGFHDLKISVVFLSNNTALTPQMTVKNFFITESPTEEIYSVDVKYGSLYEVPIYKNGFIVATPAEEVPTGVSNKPESNSIFNRSYGRGWLNVSYKEN